MASSLFTVTLRWLPTESVVDNVHRDISDEKSIAEPKPIAETKPVQVETLSVSSFKEEQENTADKESPKSASPAVGVVESPRPGSKSSNTSVNTVKIEHSDQCLGKLGEAEAAAEVAEQAPDSTSVSDIESIVSDVTIKSDATLTEELDETDDYLPVISKDTLLREILKKYKVRNSTWVKSMDGITTMVTFVVDSGRIEENVLDALLVCGIGKKEGTTVSISTLKVWLGEDAEKETKKNKPSAEAESIKSVGSSPSFNKLVPVNSEPAAVDTRLSTLPVSVSANTLKADSASPEPKVEFRLTPNFVDTDQLLIDDFAELDLSEKESEFVKSIKARIIIQPVVAALTRNAEFTFDYLVYIILASLISAVGLIENNSVILVASMLISPLMGPILAGTFGAAVQDRVLTVTGIKSEAIGLCICILTGFLLGLPIMAAGHHWTPSTVSWPSPEMFGRGLPRGIITGIIIAVVSGMAVALSVLGDNQGSLVGVAISASLLPPAVNAGLLWAYSIMAVGFPPPVEESIDNNFPLSNYTNSSLGNGSMVNSDLSSGCPRLLNNAYTPYFTCNMAEETLYLGLLSLTLTLLNIFCIIASALLCLKIKQVSPRASVSKEQLFWTQHMKVAKDYNTTVRPSDDHYLSLVQELQANLKISKTEAERIVDFRSHRRQFLYDLPDDLFDVPDREAGGGDKLRQFKRALSLNEEGLNNRRQFERLMSHPSKLESSEYGEKEPVKQGRFSVMKKRFHLTKQTSVG